MTELAVNRIVMTAFDKYERETAMPRHEENSERLEHNGEKLDSVLDIVQQIKGALIALKWIAAISAAVGTVMKIVQMAQHWQMH